MALQLTDRQRKIYKEFMLEPLGKEISRTGDLGSQMTIKYCQVKKIDNHIAEKEYLDKEYCEIMKLDLSTEFSDNLNSLHNKFHLLGLYNHNLSPNEFEYVLNEGEKVLKAEKEKNDNLIVRMNNWLERADNYINLNEGDLK